MPDFDIVVSDRESSEARLIVETKLSQTNVSDAANQLKKAMLRMSCPVGLLITPQSMTLFLDRYTSQSEDSIESIGPFETQDLLHFERKGIALQDAKHFEEVVQRWLESLPNIESSQAQHWKRDPFELLLPGTGDSPECQPSTSLSRQTGLLTAAHPSLSGSQKQQNF
jgi:hypothetical protein